MARYVNEFRLDQPDDFIRYVSEDFFRKEGFTRDLYKTGEYVWAKGDGLMVVQQFIKLEYQNGQVRLEAWVAKVGLPGKPVGEMDLNGVWAWAVKKALRDRVVNLMTLLEQTVEIPGYMPCADSAAPSGAMQGGSATQTVQQAIPVTVHNPTGKATAGLVMGIISMAAWLIPLAGLFFGALAIMMSSVGRKSTKKTAAIVGLVLGCIGTALAVLNWSFGVLLTVFYLWFQGR